MMLGDNVRLLVHNDLVPRVRATLTAAARPGWTEVEPYPGQPDAWTVFTGVEISSHPGTL